MKPFEAFWMKCFYHIDSFKRKLSIFVFDETFATIEDFALIQWFFSALIKSLLKSLKYFWEFYSRFCLAYLYIQIYIVDTFPRKTMSGDRGLWWRDMDDISLFHLHKSNTTMGRLVNACIHPCLGGHLSYNTCTVHLLIKNEYNV